MSYPDILSRARTFIGTMCENASGVQEDDLAARYCKMRSVAWSQLSIRREIVDKLKTSQTEEPAA
jgi:hypothetical protein